MTDKMYPPYPFTHTRACASGEIDDQCPCEQEEIIEDEISSIPRSGKRRLIPIEKL